MDIRLYSHHPDSWLSPEDLHRYNTLLPRAYSLVSKEPFGPAPFPINAEEIEISLVDDMTISRIHEEFMSIPGATDVITFQHGEILISLDTTAKQAKELEEPPEKELFRYMVHGLLHLRGYLDYEEKDREAMFAIQEAIVAQAWGE